MARVTICVDLEGGSTVKVTEQSAFPLHTDDQTVMLVQQAFIRTCRALGVRDQPDPAPAPPAERAVTAQAAPGEETGEMVAEAPSKTNRKAA